MKISTKNNSDSPGSTFASSAEVFLTFLYAAAVHLVIHQSHGEYKTSSVLYVLFLISFIFSDWASRTRLPRLLPETMSGGLQIAKCALEIVGVYFLVLSFLLFLDDGHGDSSHILPDYFSGNSAFAVFLLVTWFWDMLMLYVMKELDLRHLFRAVFNGTAIDIQEARIYLQSFYSWKSRREGELMNKAEHLVSELEEPRAASPLDIKVHIEAFQFAIHGIWARCPFESFVATFVQMLANHIVHANLTAGVIICLNELILDGQHYLNLGPIYDAIPILVASTFAVLFIPYCIGKLFGTRTATLALIILLVSSFATHTSSNSIALGVLKTLGMACLIFFVSSLSFIFRETSAAKLANKIGGLLVFLIMIMLYAGLSSSSLVLIIAIQQVVVNLFLQFAAVRIDGDSMAEPPGK